MTAREVVLPRPVPCPTAPPCSTVRARLAERLFRLAVRSAPVRVLLPDGTRFGAGDDGSPLMLLQRPNRFFRRIARAPNIGFGEAYVSGDWTAPEPADLLTVLAARMIGLVPPRVHRMRRLVERRQPRDDESTIDGARRNVGLHYDLSNNLFAAFLDPTMTYSSALFDGDAGCSLERAQLRKIDRVLDLAGVTSGTRLLEVGTGWGSLAVRAAGRGATVTSITLSVEQQRLARARIAEAGLANRARVLLTDYREINGSYDSIVSVEMIEAVGARYWPVYVASLDRLLRPGGRVCLQAITMDHHRMLATRDSYTWIRKYVFPGGASPSMLAIKQIVAAHTALQLDRCGSFGLDYARTLRMWRERFAAQWNTIARFGFDEAFRRMWDYYLAYSEAGFRTGYLDVSHILLVKGRSG